MVEEILKTILSRLDSLDNGQRTLQDGQKALQDGQNALQGGQNALQDGQKALEDGQKAIWEKLTEHDGILGTLLERTSSVEMRLGNVENRLEGVEKNQARLELRIENEVIEKIRALFDDREVQNNRFDIIENKLEGVSLDLRYLVTRVIRLEQVAK